MTTRREESVTLLVVALSVTLVAVHGLWQGLTGGSALAMHLIAICLGRAVYDVVPLTVLVLPVALSGLVFGELSVPSLMLPLIAALVASATFATSDLLAGRVAGTVIVLAAAALAGVLLRPFGAVLIETATTLLAAVLLECGRSGWRLLRNQGRGRNGLQTAMGA